MNTTNAPLWIDGFPQTRPRLNGHRAADVVVVGAGISGLSVALGLAEEGFQVVLLEQRTVASGATGRNAGFLLQGTAERYNRAIELMGRAKAREIHQFTLINHQEITATIKKYAIDCEYLKRGSLQLAGSSNEERELVESATLLKEDGFNATLLSASDLPAHFRSKGYNLAVKLDEDGELNPGAFARGVAAAFEQLGGKIFEGTTVTSINSREVYTLQGSIETDAVILCTNAQSALVHPWFEHKVSPVRGQMLATTPLPMLFKCPIYADHGYDYWRQDKLGRVILGGWRNLDPESEVGLAELLNQQIQDKMTEFIRSFYPKIPVNLSHQWSGIMGFAVDGLPICGKLPGSDVLVSVGFTGHGFGFAWACGKRIVELLLEGRATSIDHFAPTRLS